MEMTGAALGVKVALPDRVVVCPTGDGSAMMSLPEDIGPAIRRALESGRPSLLEVMMDSSPEALVPPRSVRATGIL